MILRNDAHPKGLDIGPGQARISYRDRGSIPVAQVAQAVLPDLAGVCVQGIGPRVGRGWLDLRRPHGKRAA